MRYVELSVGSFMVMGIVALVLMAFRVSGLSLDTAGDTYTLKARFQNLGGLTERSKVSMAGVTIGKVTKIYLDNEYYEAVVEMEIKDQSRFHQLPSALLNRKRLIRSSSTTAD